MQKNTLEPLNAISLKSDNRVKAIILMNMFCISNAIVSVLFKLINIEGVSIAEFVLWKNVVNFVFNVFILYKEKINPLSQKETKGLLNWCIARAVIG